MATDDLTRSTHPSVYKIHFKEHSIPNVTVCTTYQDTIFYFYNNAIYSYSLSTGNNIKLFSQNGATFMTILKGCLLCVVSGNVLTIASVTSKTACHPSNIHQVKLKAIPKEVTEFNDRNTHFIAFLHSNAVEIFKPRDMNNRSIPGTVITIDLPFKAKSMTSTTANSYFLTETNTIMRTANIFISQCLTLASRVVGVSGNFNCIYSFRGFIFLGSENTVSKYEITEDRVTLEYTLDTQSQNYKIVQDFLLNDTFVQLGKAPFMILKDKITYFKEGTAVGVGRVYFIENGVEEPEERVTYETNNYQTTINPSTIKIPDIIKHEKQREEYLKNMVQLKKYETLLDKLNEIGRDLEVREQKDEREFETVSAEIVAIEKKKDGLEKRVRGLRQRAEEVKFSGDVSGLYDKMTKLEKLIENLPVGKFEEHRIKLRAQRSVLRDKLSK